MGQLIVGLKNQHGISLAKWVSSLIATNLLCSDRLVNGDPCCCVVSGLHLATEGWLWTVSSYGTINRFFQFAARKSTIIRCSQHVRFGLVLFSRAKLRGSCWPIDWMGLQSACVEMEKISVAKHEILFALCALICEGRTDLIRIAYVDSSEYAKLTSVTYCLPTPN